MFEPRAYGLLLAAVMTTACIGSHGIGGSDDEAEPTAGAGASGTGSSGAPGGGGSDGDGGVDPTGTGGSGSSGGPSSGQLTWGTITRLDAGSLGFDVERANYPKLATGTDGLIHLVWANDVNGRAVGVINGNDIGAHAGDLCHAADSGSGFQGATFITAPPMSAVEGRWSRFQMVLDQTNALHVLWGWPSYGEGVKITYAKRTANGTWSPAEILAQNPGNVGQACDYYCTTGGPVVASDGNRIYAYYHRTTPSPNPQTLEQLFRVSDDGGATWSAPKSTGNEVTIDQKPQFIRVARGVGQDQVWGVGHNWGPDNNWNTTWSVNEQQCTSSSCGPRQPIAAAGTPGFWSDVVLTDPSAALSPVGPERRVAWFHWVHRDATGSPCPSFVGSDDFEFDYYDLGCLEGPFISRNPGNGWGGVEQLGQGADVRYDEMSGIPLAVAADGAGVWYLAYRLVGDVHVYVAADAGDGWSTPVEIGRGDGNLDLAPLPSGKGVRLVWVSAQSTAPDPVFDPTAKLHWADLWIE